MSDLSMLLGLIPPPKAPEYRPINKPAKADRPKFEPGQKIGSAELIRKVPAPDAVKSKAARSRAYWECRCECGALFVRRADYLRDGLSCSNKCRYAGKPSPPSLGLNDLTGKRYGRLVITGRSERTQSGLGVIWEYVCDCGNTGFRPAKILNRKGDRQCCSRGCPCLRKDWVPSVG